MAWPHSTKEEEITKIVSHWLPQEIKRSESLTCKYTTYTKFNTKEQGWEAGH